jgi:hypothetical protein
MKAILANLLFGSILCCLSTGLPAQANPPTNTPKSTIVPQYLSAKSLIDNRQYLIPLDANLETQKLDYSLSLEDDNVNSENINISNSQTESNNSIPNVTLTNNTTLSLDKNPYTYDRNQSKATIGFHGTFWPSQEGRKYWGVTTVEELSSSFDNGNSIIPKKQDSEPILPPGMSTLTVSGGGNQNLVTKTNLLGEFKNFRGGIAIHRGLTKEVTVGIGFVYDDLARGYSQFIYQPDSLPLKTTVSLVSGKEGLDVRSHLKFRPTDNFVVNYYAQKGKQQFDVDWGLVSGFNLIAKGNTKDKSLTTGFKLAIGGEYFAIFAKAELNQDSEWQWKLDSRLGNLHFIYATNLDKSNSELNYELLNAKPLGVKCSVFVKYETQMLKNNEEYLSVWGWRLSSTEKFDANRSRWSFDIGYGVGSQGEGAIASTGVAVAPDLFLKLTYQAISAVSDDMNVKVQLVSR